MPATYQVLPLTARAPALPARERRDAQETHARLEARARVALAMDSEARVRVTEWVMLDSRAAAPHHVEIEVVQDRDALVLTFDEAAEKVSIAALRSAAWRAQDPPIRPEAALCGPIARSSTVVS